MEKFQCPFCKTNFMICIEGQAVGKNPGCFELIITIECECGATFVGKDYFEEESDAPL
jgi:hypothetical protein